MRMAKLALAASPISFNVCVPVFTVLASLKSECFLCFFMHMRTHAHGRTCTCSIAHFIGCLRACVHSFGQLEKWIISIPFYAHVHGRTCTCSIAHFIGCLRAYVHSLASLKSEYFPCLLCTCAWQNLHLQHRPFHLMFACLCPQFRPAWKVNIFYSFLCTCAHMRMSKPAFAASPISLYVCVPVSTVLASLKSECFLCFFMHMRTHAHGKTCTRSVAHFI